MSAERSEAAKCVDRARLAAVAVYTEGQTGRSIQQLLEDVADSVGAVFMEAIRERDKTIERLQQLLATEEGTVIQLRERQLKDGAEISALEAEVAEQTELLVMANRSAIMAREDYKTLEALALSRGEENERLRAGMDELVRENLNLRGELEELRNDPRLVKR